MSTLLYNASGQPISIGDATANDLPSFLERYATTSADDPNDVMARAMSLITVGLMVLNNFGDGPELADVVNQCETIAAALGPAMRCKVCGCTAASPCHVDDEPCHWIEPYRCSACRLEVAA